jgi:hypothetical protein
MRSHFPATLLVVAMLATNAVPCAVWPMAGPAAQDCCAGEHCPAKGPMPGGPGPLGPPDVPRCCVSAAQAARSDQTAPPLTVVAIVPPASSWLDSGRPVDQPAFPLPRVQDPPAAPLHLLLSVFLI